MVILSPTSRSFSRGFTVAEGAVACALIALTILTLFSALQFAHFVTTRASQMNDAVTRVTHILEDIAAVPYALVTTNTYPVQLQTLTNGSSISLVYSMTTSVHEVSTPLLHKRVYIDYYWRVGNQTQYRRFFSVKTP